MVQCQPDAAAASSDDPRRIGGNLYTMRMTHVNDGGDRVTSSVAAFSVIATSCVADAKRPSVKIYSQKIWFFK